MPVLVFRHCTRLPHIEQFVSLVRITAILWGVYETIP